MPEPLPPTRAAPATDADRQRELFSRLKALGTRMPQEPRSRRELVVAAVRLTGARAGLLWLFEDNVAASPNTGQVRPPKMRLEQAAGLPDLNLSQDQELLQACCRLGTQSAAAAIPLLHHSDDAPQLPAGSALLSLPCFVGRAAFCVVQLLLPGEVAAERGGELLTMASALGWPLPAADVRPPVAENRNLPLVPVTPSVLPPATDAAVESPRPTGSEFLLELHRTLQLDHVAYTVVNDGLRMLSADRLSLAVRRGGRLHLTAVSGATRVNLRSEEMRALQRLIRKAVLSGETITYPGAHDQTPPQLERELAEHVSHSGARLVRLVPLFAPDQSLSYQFQDVQRRSKRGGRRTCIGCLVLESFANTQLSESTASLMDETALHIGTALRNSLRVKSNLLSAPQRVLGQFWESLYGRTLVKCLLLVLAIVAVTIAMALVPYDYRMTAQGRLLPVERQVVFAPWEGKIVNVPVVSGQRVPAGTVLVQLENEELRQELVATENELENTRQLKLSREAARELAHRSGDQTEEARLVGEILEADIQIAGLTQQRDILLRRVENLTVRAPLDGVVATFQVEQLLRERPVARGDVLLEVMRDDGPWELEVDVPDHRMGHLLRRLESLHGAATPVEFILQTDTERTFAGQLQRSDLSNRTTLTADGEAVVKANIALADNPDLQRRIGADVTAKVDCGPMNLGYVLFGDVWEFLQRRLWL